MYLCDWGIVILTCDFNTLIRIFNDIVKVCMCLCICVRVFKFFSETTGPMKPKFMWDHNRIGEEIDSTDSGHLLFFIIVSPREGGGF